MELNNSKISQIGQNSFSIDCSQSALQMRETNGQWKEINPALMLDDDSRSLTYGRYISSGTPYRIEFDSNLTRRIYPDYTDLSKYIEYPVHILVLPTLENVQSKEYPGTIK